MRFNRTRLLKIFIFGLLMLLLTHSSTDDEDTVVSTDVVNSRVVAK